MPVGITDLAGKLFGASWESDGTILFGQPEGIMRVPSAGGDPQLVIAAEEGELFDGPQLLPDGESVLFSRTAAAGNGRWDEGQVVVQSLPSNARTVVVQRGSDGRYLQTGHITYAVGDALLAVAFDVNTLTVTGGALPVVQGVQRAFAPGDNTASANYSVANDGTLVYLSGGWGGGMQTLAWVDRNGREEIIPIEPGVYFNARISPDGTRAVIDDRGPDRGIWIWDFARQIRTRLTVGAAGGDIPVWTPDSARVAYDNNVGGIDWKAANNTGAQERLPETPRAVPDPFFFTPGGTEVVFRDKEVRKLATTSR